MTQPLPTVYLSGFSNPLSVYYSARRPTGRIAAARRPTGSLIPQTRAATHRQFVAVALQPTGNGYPVSHDRSKRRHSNGLSDPLSVLSFCAATHRQNCSCAATHRQHPLTDLRGNPPAICGCCTATHRQRILRVVRPLGTVLYMISSQVLVIVSPVPLWSLRSDPLAGQPVTSRMTRLYCSSAPLLLF